MRAPLRREVNVDVRDILVRAAKTFVQTFLSAATVAVVVAADYPALKAAAIAAGSAALSVIWNAVLQWSASE
jgi:hypothetical protein